MPSLNHYTIYWHFVPVVIAVIMVVVLMAAVIVVVVVIDALKRFGRAFCVIDLTFHNPKKKYFCFLLLSEIYNNSKVIQHKKNYEIMSKVTKKTNIEYIYISMFENVCHFIGQQVFFSLFCKFN